MENHVHFQMKCDVVDPPRLLSAMDRMTSFSGELRRCGYTQANCAARLGVFPHLGVNFWPPFRMDWAAHEEDPVDTLLDLFMDGIPVPVDRLMAHVPATFIDAALDMNLVEITGHVLASNICLFPCYGKYIVTDRSEKMTGINQVMWLWPESFLLGGLIHRVPRKRAIDLGTGSGVHAILASDHCREVVAVDNSPRSITFSRFNAALNGVTNIEFGLSDLFDAIDSTCDLLVANPPYAPDRATKAGDNFWSGGKDGTELLQRIVEAIPARLETGGTAFINSLYPNPPGTRISDHFSRWLGGALACYDVIDLTWPVPDYEDILSEQPFVGDKSAWRFGVISLRHARNGAGWWREVAGRRLFFDDEGNCTMVADHEALPAATGT